MNTFGRSKGKVAAVRCFAGLACVVLSIGYTPKHASGAEPNKPNPYLAPADLSAAELAAFLREMQTKPKSIRQRPGFAAAMIDAAERLLEAAQSKSREELLIQAVLAKFATHHEQAVWGDRDSDARLAQLVETYGSHQDERIAAAVRFHRLEQEALAADKLEAQELPPLLEKLKQFFSSTHLDGRHLRLASTTVGIINRLEDDEQAATAYREFGALFRKSSNRRLSSYGKRIAAGAG